MNLGNLKRIVFCVATGSLLLGGLLLFLNGTSQVARAYPGSLFASPSGSGTACSQSVPCDLQTAISQSVNNDTIYLAMGTYTGAGGAVITLTKSVILLGGWDGSTSGPYRDPDTYTTALDGQGQRRVVYISENITPTLDGLRLTNGWTSAQGGGVHTKLGSHTTISNCHIYNNNAVTDGGGAYFRGDATMVNNHIYGNTAQGLGNGGGVILIHNVATALTGNRIHDNKSHWGGGIQTYKSNATLTNNDIYSNTATDSGGGANINEQDNIHHVALTGNRIYSNTAQFGGGVIVGNCAVTMTGNLVYANSAVQGGGLWFASSYAMLVNNFVVGNQTTTGNGSAAVTISGSDVRALHTTIARNSGGRAGVLVIDFYGETGTAVMTNTILVSHTVGIVADFGHAAALEGTLWGDGGWANGTDWSGLGTITTGTVNIWGAPVFLNPEAGDYHISAASAAVDEGVDAGETSDFDGDLRPAPVGTSPDIGADEVNQHFIYLPLVARK